MKRIAIALLTAFLYLPILAIGQMHSGAETSAPQLIISGQGGESCCSYVMAFRNHGPRALLKLDGQMYGTATNRKTEWVAGFLAGTFRATRVQRIIDYDAIGLWINKYCEEHPTKALVAAAIALADELGACTADSLPDCKRPRK